MPTAMVVWSSCRVTSAQKDDSKLTKRKREAMVIRKNASAFIPDICSFTSMALFRVCLSRCQFSSLPVCKSAMLGLINGFIDNQV